MPGIWGAAGDGLRLFSSLNSLCEGAWPGSVQFTDELVSIGAHAHGDSCALRALASGVVVAVDGELSSYRSMGLANAATDLVESPGVGRPPRTRVRGNVAFYQRDEAALHLSVECAGSFPLYVSVLPRGVLFCSLLRPLARVQRAEPDPIAILQFLRDAYTCNGRSLFAGIRRLLPGQVLSWTAQDGVRLSETSALWTSLAAESDADEAAESLWECLGQSVSSETSQSGRLALMMSAGWDSRTLLAAAGAHCHPDRLLGFSHGDLGSRELSIARAICESRSTEFTAAQIDDDVFSPDREVTAFARTETAMFPHWHRAGDLLTRLGVTCSVAGVYGEILGGHYGSSMVAGGLGKGLVVARTLLGTKRASPPGMTRADLDSRLKLIRYSPPAALHRGFLETIEEPKDTLNRDIAADLGRLRERGIGTPESVLEAYISEHRGSHFINAQLLSSRAFIDVSLPFADPAVLSLATALPISVKIHNRLNRIMLRRHAPDLLRFPLAATLIPASAPIAVQEASRLARKAWEDARWWLHFASDRRMAPPRLGWVNFEFLRSGVSLQAQLDGLRLDIWDRAALQARIDQVKRYEWREQLHPVFDNFARILTIDRLLAAP